MAGYGYGGAGNPRDAITRALMQITAPPPQTRLPTPPPVPPPAPSPMPGAAPLASGAAPQPGMTGAAPTPSMPAGMPGGLGASPGMPTPMGAPQLPTMPMPGTPGPTNLNSSLTPPYPPQY